MCETTKTKEKETPEKKVSLLKQVHYHGQYLFNNRFLYSN